MPRRHDGVARQFGKNLRAQRKNSGLTLMALGDRASLHLTEVGLLERGKRVPRIDTLIQLASALSVEPEALLGGINWRPETVISGEFEFGLRED